MASGPNLATTGVSPEAIATHLFVLSPNNSGSTFIAEALGRCSNAWSLRGEGQFVGDFNGPRPYTLGRGLIWAARPMWIEELRRWPEKNWDGLGKAWLGRARSRNPNASVFVERSPPHRPFAEELRTRCSGARFIISVRDPMAAAEGILRARSRSTKTPLSRHAMCTAAASHLVNCLRIQRENAVFLGDDAVVTTYERICADPAAFNSSVRALVPELDDFDIDRRIRVKRTYNERLRNMNADQIARLDPETHNVLMAVFTEHADILAHWGYHY